MGTQLPDHVQDELKEINLQMQRGDMKRQRLFSLNGYCFDIQGRIVVGPTTTKHVLHRTAAGHLDSRKLLAKLREQYSYRQDRKVAEETTRTCAQCRMPSGHGLLPRQAAIGLIDSREALAHGRHGHHGPVPVADHTATTVAKVLY